MQSLPIHFSGKLVGELTHDRGRVGLHYVAGAAHDLARLLPRREAPYDDEECRAFIGNLLPEGDWRGMLCRRLELPPTDDFGLLRWLGHDCAGAITFDDPSLEHAGDAYTPLAEPELRRWLKDPRVRPSPDEASGLRRALAGAQDKLILHVAEAEPYLCERGAPSTVIVKPDIPGPFALSALNELFCMQLASAVGLRAPRSFWFAGAFAVERFDRVFEGSRLRRVHQEDFAQLLGVPSAQKYAVGWRDCFTLVDRHVAEAEAARKQLIERLFFNLLVGNGDAHAKNFALLFSPGGPELAPAYDILCTQIYPSLSEAFAMPVGAARRQDELSASAWQGLAKEARLPLDWIKTRGAELSSAVLLALRELPHQILSQNAALAADIYPARRRDEFLRKLVDVIVGNCKRVSRTLLARA